MKHALAVGLALASFIGTPAWAAQGFKPTEVYKGSKDLRDQDIQYPQGKPEVTSMRVEIDPGGEGDPHQHPVPTYIYVLEGSLTVEFADGAQRSFQAGQGFLEVVNTTHKARNLGSAPLKFLVVFVGAEGKPNIASPEPQAGN